MDAAVVRGGSRCCTTNDRLRRRPVDTRADTKSAKDILKGVSSLMEARGMSLTVRLTSMSDTGRGADWGGGVCGRPTTVEGGRFRKGEPGRWGTVGEPGREPGSCGECGRGTAPTLVVALRCRYGGSAETGFWTGAATRGILRDSMDVNNRPGSPKDDRHDISRRPRAITLPGAWRTGPSVTDLRLRV